MTPVADMKVGETIVAALNQVDAGGTVAMFIALPTGELFAGLYSFDDFAQPVCSQAAMNAVTDAIKVFAAKGYFPAD